jgi:PKD repeat protein
VAARFTSGPVSSWVSGEFGTKSSTATIAWEHVAPEDARFEVWIYRSSQWQHHAYVDGATHYVSEGLAAYSYYSYAVRTVSGTQNSAWSNTVTATTKPNEGSNPPVASFTVSCGNSATCSFSNTSTGLLGEATWAWELGNGQTAATFVPPPVTCTAGQAYTVRLTFTDLLGRASTAEAQVICQITGNRLRCR